MRHTTQDTRPSAHPRPAVNPHTTLCHRAGSNDADVRFPPVIALIGCDNRGVLKGFEHRYRAVRGRDARFDGWFYVAVTSTGIYCRPSCPAATPKRSNVRFYPTAAAAQYAGFRACKRCRPDAVPGSPEWDTRADIVARAMRLIADGVVDRDGVAGLARRLCYTERHLHRLLSPRSVPVRSLSPARGAPTPPGCSWRRRTCRSPRWRSPPDPRAYASSTTRYARSSP